MKLYHYLNFLFLGLAVIKIKCVRKTRTKIPNKIRVAVLKEYHHKCSICDASEPAPELHHIDEHPSNHDSLNILPLCPNCHRSKLNSRILSIFRKYKSREILSVQFEQLFKKAARIFDLSEEDYYPDCYSLGDDLVAFVRQLKKGKYYAPKIYKLVRAIPELNQETKEEWEAFDRQRREDIMGLIVELLPFQNWKPKALPEN